MPQNVCNTISVMRKKCRTAHSSYAVGYGRPPTSAQFQPGQSGNPKGRPKGARNASSLAREALERPINVKVKGTSRKMTVRKAAYFRLAERAVAGDVKALGFLLSLESEERPAQSDEPDVERSAAKDLEILHFLIAGAPARCKASRVTIQSAGPARLKGEPNDQPKSTYRLCEQPPATSAASRWSNNQSRSR
jgi:hypothetical protein